MYHEYSFVSGDYKYMTTRLEESDGSYDISDIKTLIYIAKIKDVDTALDPCSPTLKLLCHTNGNPCT